MLREPCTRLIIVFQCLLTVSTYFHPYPGHIRPESVLTVNSRTVRPVPNGISVLDGKHVLGHGKIMYGISKVGLAFAVPAEYAVDFRGKVKIR